MFFPPRPTSRRLKCSRFLPGGGLIYHWRECRYFINYIHRTSDVGRACVSTRRDVGWNARHEFQPNTAPSSLPPHLSFFIHRVRITVCLCPPCLFEGEGGYIRKIGDTTQVRIAPRCPSLDAHFPLESNWKRKIRKLRRNICHVLYF